MGESGADTFRFQDVGDAFNGTSNDGDFFYDFTPGQDRIQIDAAAFGLNTLSPGSFVSGWSPAATTGGPTFLYSTASAYLLYDADGTGANAPVLLAILNGIPAITANDFTFY